VNRGIAGIIEAMQFMEEGGKYKLFIPSHLAYGEKGVRDVIGPNQDLWFDYEIVAIKAQQQQQQHQEKHEQESYQIKEKPYQEQYIKKSEWQTTPSGLMYHVIKKGNGKRPTLQDTVTVKYQTYTPDGRIVDSTDEDESIDFVVNRGIAGIIEAMQFMEEGGKYKLFIPSHLAYGEKGVRDVIGPNQDLWFNYEIVAIKKQTKI